jgi:outer membrane protein TolC
MRSAAAVLVPALLAACTAASDADPRAYERILLGEAPVSAGRDAGREGIERLRAAPRLSAGDAYRLALHRSESLALDGEELVRRRLRWEQALGAALPALSFKGSYTRQDSSTGASSSSVQSSFTLRDRTQYQFTLHQPLFKGLEEIYEARRRDALAGAQEEALRHAKLLLYADVAMAYSGVLLLEREVATGADSLRLAEERLEELRQRQRAGISRRTEVLSQEAEAATVRAVLERTRGLLDVAWDALRFVCGLEGRPALEDLPSPTGELPPLADCVGRALLDRRDLQALRRESQAAAESVGVARAGYFPTLSLDANYYTHREGISKEVDWDLVLSLEVPIFEGMVTQARIREARSEVRSAGLRERLRRREIELEVGRAWSDARAFAAELAALERALASGQENYDLVQAEYRRGIAPNVEVLAAFDRLQRARLDHERSRIRAALSRTHLEVVQGVLPAGAAP